MFSYYVCMVGGRFAKAMICVFAGPPGKGLKQTFLAKHELMGGLKSESARRQINILISLICSFLVRSERSLPGWKFVTDRV